jgi:hypothetical protein
MKTEATFIISIQGTTITTTKGEDGSEVTGTNAAAAIQQAITDLGSSGGKIFIKRGTYDLSTAAINLNDNVTLEGESAEAGGGTKFTSPEVMIRELSGKSNVALRRLVFDGGTDAYALAFTGTKNVMVEQCHFSNFSFAVVTDPTVDVSHAVVLSGCENVRFVECSFRNIQGRAIQNATSLTNGIQVIRCLVDGAGQGSTTDGAANFGGIHLMKVVDVLIDGNTVRNCGSIGIAVDTAANPSFVRVVNNAVRDNDRVGVLGQGHGIYVAGDGIGDYIVTGNIVAGNGGNGIEVNSGSGTRVVVANNVVDDNGTSTPDGIGYGHGIWATFLNAVVSANIITRNHGSGIALGFADDVRYVNVQGNIVANNGQGGSPNIRWKSGIVMMRDGDDTNVYDVQALIQNNLIYDEQTPTTQQNGIYLDSNVDSVVIEGNKLFGNGAGLGTEQIVYTAHRNAKVRRNEGFRTENNGTAVFGGAGTITIPHRLDITPVRAKFRLMAFTAASTDLWISNVTSTTFEIRSSTGSANVGWSYAED